MNHMDSAPQGRKMIQSFSFNQLQSKNKKNKLSWSNIKSDSSYNIEKLSHTKSFWSNLKLDASYKIENSINNKTSWCNLTSDSSFDIKKDSSLKTPNNLDRASIDHKKNYNRSKQG